MLWKHSLAKYLLFFFWRRVRVSPVVLGRLWGFSQRDCAVPGLTWGVGLQGWALQHLPAQAMGFSSRAPGSEGPGSQTWYIQAVKGTVKGARLAGRW